MAFIRSLSFLTSMAVRFSDMPSPEVVDKESPYRPSGSVTTGEWPSVHAASLPSGSSVGLMLSVM